MSAHPSRTHHPIDRLLEHLDRVKPTGPGTWLASCPTPAHKHGDRSRGLSVREGDDGRVLIHCFGGCPVSDIVSALGISLSDLFPSRPDHPDRPPRHGRMSQPARPRRIPWRDLFEGMESDLLACSLAFCDLAAGHQFSEQDAATIAKTSRNLADQIMEVRHG